MIRQKVLLLKLDLIKLKGKLQKVKNNAIYKYALIVLLATQIMASKTDAELRRYYTKEWNSLFEYQIRDAYKIYNYAYKDDVSWTATAIAFMESKLGRWQVATNSHARNNKVVIDSYDCGVFHNNTSTVLKRESINNSTYNAKEACTDLILDFSYSYTNFLAEIKFWQKVYGNNWRKIWGAYNSGYGGNKEYARNISAIIRVLKRKLDPSRLINNRRKK